MKRILCLIQKSFFCFLFFFPAFWLNAQARVTSSVAIFPLWGEDKDIAEGFGEELFSGIRALDDYIPWWVDMTNIPPDVPTGGFPPYVCPSPSTTGVSPLAITGEVILNKSNGLWRLRLYLWRMADSRLVISDELSTRDQEECRNILPYILTWIFSQAKEDPPVRLVVEQSSEQQRAIFFTADVPPSWLYLGLRLGGSIRIYSGLNSGKIFQGHDQLSTYDNFHFAFHAYGQLLSYLGIQIEAMFTHILDNYYLFESWSFTFPLMLRFSYRIGTMTLSVLGGAYVWIPVGEISNENNKYTYIPRDPPLGYTAGIMFGNKIGPGSIFLDVRWASDFRRHVKNNNPYDSFIRSMVNISFGYELSFFEK